MALLDAYATAAEYRAAVGDKATGTDTTLDAQLTGMSRLLERALEVIPGAWNDGGAAQAMYVDVPYAKARLLRFRDSSGLGFWMRAIDDEGIGIDTDRDGTYDGYAFDLTDETWIRGYPSRAAASSEPWTGLEIIDRYDSEIAAWPQGQAMVKLTGTLGWAAVPPIIKELVIHRTHELREAQKAGATVELPSFDGAVPMQPKTLWLWRQAESLYGRKLPV